MAEWTRVVNTTTHRFIKEEEINILRNRKVTALLESRGRIEMNCDGDLNDWKVRWRRAPMTGYADTDTLTFTRRDRDKTAQLAWRGYSITDSVTKKERLMNKGTPQIVKIYDDATKKLMDDIEDQFGDEIYINGDAAANVKRMHGMESMMASATVSAGNLVGVNAKTYAGLDTTRGAYGGTWTGTWPVGYGDSHYDFWTPTIVDTTNTGWASATKTFAANATEQMRFMIQKTQKNKSKKGKLDLILLEGELYRQYLAQLDSKEQVFIQRGEKSGGLQTLGFTDVQNLDGCDVSWEYGIPSSVGYAFNIDMMQLCSLQSGLFVPDGPDWDPASKSYRFSVDFFGNLRFNPRFFGKFVVIT